MQRYNYHINWHPLYFFFFMIGLAKPFSYATRLYCLIFLPKSFGVFVLCFWPFWISSNWISIRTYYMYFSLTLVAEWVIPTSLLYVLKYVLFLTFFYAHTFSNPVISQLAAILNTSSIFTFSSITFTVKILSSRPKSDLTWK